MVWAFWFIWGAFDPPHDPNTPALTWFVVVGGVCSIVHTLRPLPSTHQSKPLLPFSYPYTQQVLVTEAGGVVRATDGGEFEFHMSNANLICGNADVIPPVVAVISAADKKMWKKVGGFFVCLFFVSFWGGVGGRQPLEACMETYGIYIQVVNTRCLTLRTNHTTHTVRTHAHTKQKGFMIQVRGWGAIGAMIGAAFAVSLFMGGRPRAPGGLR